MEERIEDRLKRMIVDHLFMKIAPEELDKDRSLIEAYGSGLRQPPGAGRGPRGGVRNCDRGRGV